MISRVNKISSKNRHSQSGGTAFGWFLVVVIAFALIFVGSLIWINNSVAIIPDNDPLTFIRLEIIAAAEPQFQAADHDWEDLAENQIVVRGNGDRDDNREQPFVLSLVEFDIVPIIPIPATISFADSRMVVAYWKFGHLKIMPAAEMFFTVLNLNRDICKASRVAL